VYINIPVKTVEELDSLMKKGKAEQNVQFLVCFNFFSDIHNVHMEKNNVINFSSVSGVSAGSTIRSAVHAYVNALLHVNAKQLLTLDGSKTTRSFKNTFMYSLVFGKVHISS